MGNEDIEKQFLVNRLNDIINVLKNDSDKQNLILRNLGRLPHKLEQLKEALNSKDKAITKKETLYKIKNHLADWQVLSNRSSPVFLIRFRSQIKILKKEIDLFENPDPNSIHTILPALPPPPPSSPPQFPELTTRSPDSVNVHGVEDKINCLVRMLALRRDKNRTEFRAVGFSGMKGVGKTMLCQQVFKHDKVTSYFLPRIWVCLSRKENDEKDHRKVVVDRILKTLAIEEDEKKSLKELLYILRMNLLGKNYLIVLDDAWKQDEAEFFSDLNEDEAEFFSDLNEDEEHLTQKLAYGFPKGAGGAIIVTSRWEEMVKLMVGMENSKCLTADLDRESCWSIFKDEAEKGTNHKISKDIEALKDEIVKKCDGLPLAAKILGQLAKVED